MKRLRDAEEEEEAENLTYDFFTFYSLVPDTIDLTLSFLDPLSQFLFTLTTREHYATFHAKYHFGSFFTLQLALFSHATLPLIKQYHWKTYPISSLLDRRYYCSLLAARGALDILQWMHENQNAVFDYSIPGHAARHGHMHVLQWLHSIGQLKFGSNTLEKACKFGSVENIEWIFAHGYPDSPSYREELRIAIKHGHLKIVQWLLGRWRLQRYVSRHPSEFKRCRDYALQTGHLDIVKWFDETHVKDMQQWVEETEEGQGVPLPCGSDDDL